MRKRVPGGSPEVRRSWFTRRKIFSTAEGAGKRGTRWIFPLCLDSIQIFRNNSCENFSMEPFPSQLLMTSRFSECFQALRIFLICFPQTSVFIPFPGLADEATAISFCFWKLWQHTNKKYEKHSITLILNLSSPLNARKSRCSWSRLNQNLFASMVQGGY